MSTEKTTDLPHAVWYGSFHLFGVEVKCHTLSNGQRIIEADSMNKLFEAMGDGPVIKGDIEEFAKWQRGWIGGNAWVPALYKTAARECDRRHAIRTDSKSRALKNP